MKRQLSRTGPFEEHAWNKKPVNFIRSFKYTVDAGVAIVTLDRIFRAISISAIDLHGFVNRVVEHFASKDFQNRTFDGVFFDGLQGLPRIVDVNAFEAAINQAGGSIDHAFRYPDAYGHFREFVLDGPEAGDRLTKRDALFCISDGII